MSAKVRGGGVITALVCLGLLTGCRHGNLNKGKLATMRAFGLRPAIPTSMIPDAIDAAADRHGIRRELLRALIHIESGTRQSAISNKGAIGLAQVMGENSSRCGFKSALALRDPLNNIECGAQILREELDTYGGDERKALQAYNGGPQCLGKCSESIRHATLVLSLAKRLVG